jgi:hypothetical protein
LLRLRWNGHVERTNNERMPKQVAAAKMKGIGKRGRPQKTRTDEVEDDLETMGMRNWRTVARVRKEYRTFVLEADVHDGQKCLKRRRRRRRRRRRKRRL